MVVPRMVVPRSRGVESIPTVLRQGPYRFYFYSHESTEPPHVHVSREGRTAKIWLNVVEVARPGGFSAHELRWICAFVRARRAQLLEAWHEHFGLQG